MILWSVIAPLGRLASGSAASSLEAAAEWPLASLRQLGLQASVDSTGAIRTPMGVVGACARVELNGVDLTEGVIDYAVSAEFRADFEAVEIENVRSQSGLPLPLVVDRFGRMARTLYRAATDTPTKHEIAATERAVSGCENDVAG
ncbi:hypothetical protein AB1K54_09110 [Microbacterium sp. BWT-B31]